MPYDNEHTGLRDYRRHVAGSSSDLPPWRLWVWLVGFGFVCGWILGAHLR